MALPPLILPATGSAGTIACVTVSTQLVARISVFSAKRTQMMENKFRICNDLRNDEVREITKRTQMKGSSLFSVGARDSWPSRSDPVTVAVGFSPRNAWICWPPTFTTVHVASVVGHGFCRPRSRARKSVAGVSTKRTQMNGARNAWICWPPTFTTFHVASVVGHGFCRPRSRARKSVAGVSAKRTQI